MRKGKQKMAKSEDTELTIVTFRIKTLQFKQDIKRPI